MKVASRNEIKLGEATCLSSIDGEIKEYKLEITKIYQNNNYDNKSIIANCELLSNLFDCFKSKYSCDS